MSRDTIVAIATASGVSSISIVRISGPKATLIASKLTHDAALQPRVAHLTSVYDSSDEIIDRAIVLYFQNPYSFTGEDIVEFQCHGGVVVARAIVEATLEAGARLADAGEFSKRAFLNGKIDLSEAEAISKLIEAQSLQAARMLARQLKGELGVFVDECRDEMLRLLAHSEVMIDYSQEDIPEGIIDSIKNQMQQLHKKMDDIVEKSIRRRGMIDGFKVAIIGKPNSGKSSLLNGLLSYDRAIVSDVAGTTRDTIEERVQIGSHVIRLIDTAGIRDDASDEIEKIGIKRSIESIEDADIVIVLFDGSEQVSESDKRVAELIAQYSDKKFIVALSKADLPRVLNTSFLTDDAFISISHNDDFSGLIEELERVLDEIQGDGSMMLVSTRQIDAVQMSMRELEDAELPLEDEELELFSYHIQEAVKHISSITRAYNSEEILDKMFGEFCLGK